jgi:hypothetical protein
MKHYFSVKNALFAIAVSLGAVANTEAAYSTNYGNFFGSTVSYYGVSEATLTETNALFRQPTISGNTLDFNPLGFGAFASCAGGFDFTDGQLDLTIKANAGNAIPTIQFSEQGDFSLIGVGTAATTVDVSATFFIDIINVDGVGIGSLSTSATMTFSPVASGTMTLPGYPGSGQLWSGVFSFDVNAFLTANSIPYLSGATEIKVTLDNTLYAFSEAGTAAFIAKKDFKGLGITVPEVPEPTILTMVLCGGAAMLIRRKAKK